MKGDYFYSESTGLYVSRKPLVIDARVKDAAERAGVRVDWDDEGRINYIDFDDAKALMHALGSELLDPIEYWNVLDDAREANDTDMVDSLMSNRSCEWL